jgi:hypothetical protein
MANCRTERGETKVSDMTSVVISKELASYLAGGNSMVVATRSAALEPHATRACGLWVLEQDRVAVLLPRATSAQAIANLEQNGEIAVCVSWPKNFRTFQLKGRCLGVAESSPDDVLRSEQQLQGFGDAVAQFGYRRAQARNLWLFDSWRVEVQVTSVYAQTPGPGAGARMEST